MHNEHVTEGIDCWCAPVCQTPDGRELSRAEAEMKNAVGEAMVIIHNEVTRGNLTPEQETARAIAESEVIERYIRGLKWHPSTSEEVRTSVAGNIRGFYAWLCDNGHLRASPTDKEG